MQPHSRSRAKEEVWIRPLGVTHRYEADPHRRSYNYESILYSELQDHVRACDRRISVRCASNAFDP